LTSPVCGDLEPKTVEPKTVSCFTTYARGVTTHTNSLMRDVRLVSKARLVITAVVVEGRTQSEAARALRGIAVLDLAAGGPLPI
jgi:hypothetical protein